MADLIHDPLTPLFSALADPTRRAVLTALSAGPQPVSILAQPHHMALPSFMKHLDKLERAGLVSSHKQGRVRTCQLQPDALRPLRDWLAREDMRWAGALDRLSTHLDASETGTKQ